MRKTAAAVFIGMCAGMWANDIPWNYDVLGLWIFWLPCVPAILALALMLKDAKAARERQKEAR